MVFAKVESARFKYVRSNQKSVRVDIYKNLYDAISGADSVDPSRLGTKTILPPSFCGSLRDMYRRYQDAMCIVRNHGKPDLFITFTCNPSWTEIAAVLKNGESVSNRPDLVSRVLRQKFEEFTNEIVKRHIFSIVNAYMYTVEFKKCILPHLHLLLMLEDRYKIRNI